MGCASSKSTPVVDSIAGGANDLKEGSNGLLKKGKDAVKGMADDVCEMGHGITQKIGAMTDKLKSSQPNTPETERVRRAADGYGEECELNEVNGSPKVPVRILSIDVDEDNKDELQDNQVPVKVSLSIGDSDNEGGEKPPTPMPEAVINNAIWPLTISELRENQSPDNHEAQATPLDTIVEERRIVDLPSAEGEATIEILTIEITEIPIVDDGTTTPDAETEPTDKSDEGQKGEAEG